MKFKITIKHTKVSEDETDFPLLVSLANMPSQFWSTVINGGGDIRCYANDGTTSLAREVVSCDTGTSTGELYIKTDLSASVDTVIYVEVDGVGVEPAANSAYGSEAVWSNGYLGVYHLNNVHDSTGNSGDVSMVGSSPATPGILGSGRSFDGNSQYLQFPSIAGIQSVSILGNYNGAQATQANQYRILLDTRTGGTNTIDWKNGHVEAVGFSDIKENGNTLSTSAPPLTTDAWTNIYLADTTSYTDDLTLMNLYSASPNFKLKGDLEEFRLSSTTRSEGWQVTESNNLLYNNTFFDVVYVAAPVADFSATPLSGNEPLTVIFTDNSTNTPTSWLWDFGDGNTSALQNPSHTYAAAGDYDVSLTATNAGGNNTKIITNYVTVLPTAPMADFTGTPLSGNEPLTVVFTDNSTNTPTSWLWDFGDGNTSTSQNPTHTYAADGTYDVSLTATNAGGNNTKTITGYITVLPAVPVVDFSGTPVSGNIPLTVAFTDNSTNTPTSWLWDFGDGNTSTLQNPSHTYAADGNYDVSLTATNAGGDANKTVTDYITVLPPAPVADFTASQMSGVVPYLIQFTDNSTNTPTSWLWNFGDGNTSALQNPDHVYDLSGIYDVSLTAGNANGNNTKTRVAYITMRESAAALGTSPLTIINYHQLLNGLLPTKFRD